VDSQEIRDLIRHKLLSGSLPQSSAATVFGSPADGETCDGCEEMIPIGRFVIDAVARVGHSGKALQFHLLCFVLWNAERW
jgi:hypothetical protein